MPNYSSVIRTIIGRMLIDWERNGGELPSFFEGTMMEFAEMQASQIMQSELSIGSIDCSDGVATVDCSRDMVAILAVAFCAAIDFYEAVCEYDNGREDALCQFADTLIPRFPPVTVSEKTHTVEVKELPGGIQMTTWLPIGISSDLDKSTH